MADFETPELKEYVVIPKYKDGTMGESSPFLAKEQYQEPLGFPGDAGLVDGWKEHTRCVKQLTNREDKH